MTFMTTDPIYIKLKEMFELDNNLILYHFALVCQPSDCLGEFVLKRNNLQEIVVHPYNPYVLLMFEGSIIISPENCIQFVDKYFEVK